MLMKDFTYFAPTKIHFGREKYKNIGKIVAGYGFSRILMLYGKDSIKKSGLYDEVVRSLNESGVHFAEMGGVEPNPKLSFVREAVALAKKEKSELILAVGGGSVIDAAKYTALGAVTDTDVWEFTTRRATPDGALPVGCILTISAAGSEMSSSAVITNMELNMKRGLGGEFNRPLFSILCPELTFSVPQYHTACGIVDIMSHTMERYFSVCEDTPLTDRIAEALLKSVIEAARVLISSPDDYNARATVMWASSLSHNDLTGCGRENALAVHQLEHALSGEFDHIAHGAGLAVLFPAWCKAAYTAAPQRFAQFARRVWDVEETDDLLAARQGIAKMEEFFAEIGMRVRLRDFGIKNCAERLAYLCTFGKTRTVSSYILLDFEKIKEIFESCY